MIEDMFQHVRGAEAKQQDPKVLGVMAMYQKAIANPTPLSQRDVPTLSVSHEQWYTKAPASGLGMSFARIIAKKLRAALPKACQR
eukprot:11208076-Lingulodinium_polyedra.AAC.1